MTKDVRSLYDRIRRSQKRRDLEVPMWTVIEDMVDGQEWAKKKREFQRQDTARINLCADFIRQRQSAVLPRAPRFVLRPVKRTDYAPVPVDVYDSVTGQSVQEAIPRYRVSEDTLNFVAQHPDLNMLQAIQLMDKSALMAIGVLMVGYLADYETVEPGVGAEEVPPDPMTGLPDLSGMAHDDKGELQEDEDGNPIPMVTPTSEQWFVEWVPYRRMLFDPDGENSINSHSWIGMEVIRPLKAVKRDKIFKNTASLKATGRYDDQGNLIARAIDSEQDTDNDDDVVRLYYLWLWEDNRFVVLADGHDKKLRDTEIPRGVDKHPFVIERLEERIRARTGESGGSWYYRPLLADLVPVNQNYDRFNTHLLSAASRSARKAVARKGTFNPQEMDKLTSPDDGEIVEVDVAAQIPIEGLVVPVNFPPMSQDIPMAIRLQEQHFNRLAGQGVGGGQADSATEASIWQGSQGLREEAHRNLLAGAIRQLGKKLDDSIQGNMTMELAVAINGADGRLHQMIVNHDDIVGDFDVTVDVQDMMPRNEQTEKAQIIEVLNATVQGPWLMTEKPVARTILGTFGIRDDSVIDAIVKAAQKQTAAMNAPAPGAAQDAGAPPVPGQIGPGEGAGPPENTGEMLMQQGGQMGPLLRGAA
ncbi:MAG: hypothetical protein WC120_05355 [Parcubacteria group bacterium]|jgi:hypothetical protein